MTPPLIAGLEFGSRHFILAVGERKEHGQLLIRAVESIPAQGIQRGVLSDPIECSDAISRLVRQAERRLGLRIPRILAALHGNHVKGYNATASIPIPDPAVGISPRDVERVITTCRTLSLDYDRQILHSFEQGFAVDGQTGIKDPVGLYGTKLSVQLHLVTALNMMVQNLTRVLNRAGLELKELVLPGLAAAEATLSDLDRDLGVTLISIGEFRTEALLFTDGLLRETFLIPWGTDFLTESLSKTLKLARATAEQLMEQVRTLEEPPAQAVAPELVDGRSAWASLPLRVKSGSLVRTFPQGQVVSVVQAKVREFLGRLLRQVEQSPYFRESAAGIVMVGSLARVEGFLEMAERNLNMPVRLGVVREMELDPQVDLSALHVTSVGLLRHAVKKETLVVPSRPLRGWLRWVDRTRKILEDYF